MQYQIVVKYTCRYIFHSYNIHVRIKGDRLTYKSVNNVDDLNIRKHIFHQTSNESINPRVCRSLNSYTTSFEN